MPAVRTDTKTDASVCSFPPLLGSRPRVLILGSMPGERSLQENQYYAHPANSFWRLLGDILDFDASAPYAQRVTALTGSGIALWDVIARCRRQGSADSAIETTSIEANDLPGLLGRHRSIRAIFFNGRRAEQEFMRRIWTQRQPWMEDISLTTLPSSSPAYAVMSFAQKLEKWRCIGEALLPAESS